MIMPSGRYRGKAVARPHAHLQHAGRAYQGYGISTMPSEQVSLLAFSAPYRQRHSSAAEGEELLGG